MDVTDEHEKLSRPTPSYSQQHVSSPSNIPQMIVTSADDVSEEQKNVTECTLVLIPPSNGHSTDRSDRDTSAEFTEPANSDPEGKPVVDFEDISVVVRDVVSKCTESVSHSVRQRPLVIEVEKNVQQQESSKDSSSIKCPPLPPPVPVPSNVAPPPLPSMSPSPTPSASSPLTAVQRPLVFEGAASKTEPVIELQKDIPPTDMTEIKGELICDKVPHGIQHTSDVSTEGVKSSEECTTPTKKEGFHGVKKFFDSLLHSETPETEVKLEEAESAKESDKSPDVAKSEKDVKKILQSPKDSRPELSHSPELPSENKETTSFAKDAKQNIKSFFDSFKHETVESKDSIKTKGISGEEVGNEQTALPSTSDTSKDGKESTSFAKDAKQNIKALFDTFKIEPSEQKKEKKSSIVNVDSENQTEEKAQSRPESPKESTSFTKDAKENIKAFFDTFKHESGDQKHKSSISKKSVSQPNIGEGTDIQEVVSENIKDQKESTSFSKDAKQNIKALFDTFKPETKEQKPKTSVTKKSGSQPDVQEVDSDRNVELSAPESPKESSSFVKDTKQNIKSFFDTFKSESSDLKNKDTVCKKSASHSDFTKESKEIDLSPQEPAVISKEKEPASFAKGAKQNVKAFFDTFKHESSTSKSEDAHKKVEDNQSPLTEEFSNNLSKDAENTKPIEQSRESASFVKDTKQNIKSFFKHDSSSLKTKDTSSKLPTASEPNLNKQPTEEGVAHQKDTKQNIKSFFKHDSSSLKTKDASSKIPATSEPNLNKQPTDEGIAHQKDTKHSIKKFFSFKNIGEGGETISPELSGSLDSQLPKESGKSAPLKVTKSVRLDLDPKYSTNGAENISASFTYMNGHETELISEKKERAQSVPSDAFRKSKNFGMLEAKGSEVSSLDSPCESPTEHKDSRQGIKKFFDSFKHEKSSTHKDSSQSVSSKKESSKDLSAVDVASVSAETKVTEKPTKDKKNKSIKRSFSDKVSREEVVQNFKGFFDSISHRAPSKKSLRDSEHIYDVVEVKTEAGSSVPTLYISNEADTSKISSSKTESQGMKKILSPFRSKDPIKSGSENIYITPSNKVDQTSEESSKKRPEPLKLPSSIKVLPDSTSSALKDDTLKDLSPTVSEPGSPKPDKSSMFNAIGENIIALKDKMLHNKEKRKSELFEDSVKVSESHQKSEMEKEKNQEEAIPSTSKDSNKENIKDIKAKPVPAEKPKQPKVIPTGPTPQAANLTEGSNGAPSSLYDSCCMKIAVLLRDKALDIVSDRTKSPPPKPPKPTAEAIAKARAKTISRRLADAHKKGHSVGESFPIGCDSMRFVDDDTESSCDYKDVENFDYIMDYELLNRYKVDSSKLDTFSASSGLTSYYTADTVTSRDEIYSDALMETISLGSDISYNLNRLPSFSKSEPKISPGDSKKSKKESASSKQLTAKKVPPPIPPKPLILQNISKIKEKPDEKTLSQCVNGLSLSPRLQNKFSKDPAATQKRPLMVADIKGTQFSSLQHPKKNAPQKPARNFDTVLRNDSLKKVPSVSSDSVGIVAEKMTEGDPNLKSIVKVEKRTISPPRPPPPNIAKKPEKLPKPERPPPPVKSTKNLPGVEIVQENAEKEHVNQLADSEKLSEDEIPNLMVQSVTTKRDQDSTDISWPVDKNRLEEVSVSSVVENSDKSLPAKVINDDSYQHDLKIQQDSLNNNIEISKDVTDSLNNNVKLSEDALVENPKPPPRIRRIRSRTVEVVPTAKQEERLKRSNSLSEMDVQKRVTFLNAEKAKVDSKSLYTTINKNGKRSNNEKTSQSSPDLVSCRPLPAPPPPPRRFRSLERKNKSKAERKDELSASPAPSEDSIKAPSRRKRTEKERFFSLHSDQRKNIDEAFHNDGRAMSVPSKPDRKKTSASAKYDVNANISDLDSSQDFNFSNENIPNVDTTDSLGRSKSRGDSRKTSLSNWYDTNESLGESWETIDAISTHDLTEDVKPSPKVPLRRKLEAKRKSRETSKFYVNVDAEATASPVDQGSSPLPPNYKPVSPLSLVDKETSPLPLDCSEKSVQTSLETLSQGIISRDEQSRDEQSEDTDELLDLAQTLQKELSVIINRHKSVNESTGDTPSPPLSEAASEKNLAIEFKETKKASSARSSTSEVWPITSSDESDIERVGEDSSNINEVAVKRKQKKIFFIAREIMTSEEAFVDALKLLNTDFKAAVEAANKQKNMTIIPDEALAQILNHLPQLQHLNENLLMELKDRIENWEKHEKIADIIVKMGPFLKLYSWYIHDFESNVSLLEDCKKKYPAFAQVVKEFEMSARCKRLALNHYMLKPIQRIPQYRLLLQEYLHHLMESSKDYQDTVAALQIVSEVANHANDSMKHGDNAQKLISIQNSIMGHKEIVKPGRIFVKEGELMKLSRKGMQPRWFVLFNDLLLYLTPVQQGLYRVNHELPLTGMKVAIPIQQDYQNEFSIISVTRSFTLAARSQEERQEWIIALTKAIEENASKRSTFTNSRLNQKAQDKTSSEDEAAFVLGKKAPVWIPDARVTMCQLCTSEFTVTFRRHHCRACGKVVCSICSSHRISLPYLGNRIARVCDECHIHLGQGSSACTESGETDSDNQQIAVKSHLRTDNRHLKKNKRMLPSVLKEVCANDQGSTISGYLHKRTAKSWKRDWFVVKDKVLYEYKASEDVAALRSTPLLGYEIELFSESCEGIDSSLLFQLTHPGQAPIVFYADTVGSAERWVSALKTATVLE